MTEKDSFDWRQVLTRVTLNALSHPVEYVKVLIQIGHEPLPTYTGRTMFGGQREYYPNIFKYLAHIRKTDGFFGCYRGLTAKLTGNIAGGLVFQHISENIVFQKYKNENIKNEDLTVEQRTQRFIENSIKETAGRIGALIVSQPFHVICIRMMAEFVGEDGIYTGVLESIHVIYREEGLKGFFSGVIPRLIADIGALWIGNTIIHIINNYMVEEVDSKEYIRIAMRFLASSFMYPFQMVTNCMAVTNCGLKAGSPPYMLHYDNWQSCYNHLAKMKALKRGSSLIWRAYCGPLITSHGLTIPHSSMFP